MVRYVDFKDILQKGSESSKNIFMIFDWLSVSFRYAVKWRVDNQSVDHAYHSVEDTCKLTPKGGVS